MKKFLLSLAACAITLGASAEKVVFICADSEWTYTGDAQSKVIIPEGFYLTDYNDATTKPKTLIKKSLACDFVNIEASGAFKAGAYPGFTTKSVDSKNYAIGGSFRWYTNAGLTVTPAAGITVNKINIRSQSYTGEENKAANYVFPFTPDAANTVIDCSNLECPMLYGTITDGDKPFYIKPTGQVRISWMEFEYTGTLNQPKMPVTNVTLPYLEADKEVTLTSSEGADIYYTLDGTEPTTESTKYTGAFKLTNDVIIRAIAVKGETKSFPLYQQIFSVPAGLQHATFNWSDWETLTYKDGSKIKKDDFIPTVEGNVWPCNAAVNMTTGTTFTNNGVNTVFTEGTKKGTDESGAEITVPIYDQIFRSWTFGNVVELRPATIDANTLTPASFTINAPDNGKIEEIVIIGSSLTGLKASVGEFKLLDSDTARGTWEGEATSSITFTDCKYIDQVYVFFSKDSSSVYELNADENAPVEYYNLQGIRVANPENGIFIRRQGNKATKVLLK